MPKDKLKKRFNAKARGDLGERKRQLDDTNAELIAPQAHQQNQPGSLEPAPVSDGLGKAAARKKRKLDNYIAKKLKQDRKTELLKQLAVTSNDHNGHLILQSSASLGSRVSYTGQQKLDRKAALEQRKRDRVKALVGEKRRGFHSESGSESSAVEEEGESQSIFPSLSKAPEETSAMPVAALGSALRPGMKPVVVQKPKRAKTAWARSTPAHREQTASDSSFDSSDSQSDPGTSGESLERDAEDSSWYGFSQDEAAGSDVDLAPGTAPQLDEGVEDQATARHSGFKAWAQAQIDAAKGIASSNERAAPAFSPETRAIRAHKPLIPFHGISRGPLGEDLQPTPPTSLMNGPTLMTGTQARTVLRDEGVQEARMKLPILAEEETVMEAIRQNSVVVICGETGSGKTTQVPQFLYEAGFAHVGSDNAGMIAVTQPRRVAAVSMAARVGTELNVAPNTVSYQIRYDTRVSANTAIKFMTDGVLLREVSGDLLLSKYSVVIVDEAHERTLNTDILIGVLSRAVRLREEDWRARKEGAPGPLRLIIMSATLRVSDFSANLRLFGSPPPTITVPARQHPVTMHFSRKTKPDYLGEAYSKVCKIHARLPPGGVLVFLTSQQEIHILCRRLGKRFGQRALAARREQRSKFGLSPPPANVQADRSLGVNAADGVLEAEDVDTVAQEHTVPDIDDLEFSGSGVDRDDVEALDSSEGEIESENAALQSLEREEVDVPMHILPLYSLLSTEQQLRVFETPPAGSRLIVIATNIAETSLTIPNIRYVVDCGRAKERHYDVASGMQTFRIGFISKASAAQRAGRAGRTGPGHCYRLYSSAVFENHFEMHALPEILRMPVDGVVLQMKAMGLNKVANFPFPTPPIAANLQTAETTLVRLGAVDSSSAKAITAIGRTMSLFPLSPRYARMLAGSVTARDRMLLPYVIAMVCALSIGEIFVREESLQVVDEEMRSSTEEDDNEAQIQLIKNDELRNKERDRLKRRQFFKTKAAFGAVGGATSDVFTLLGAVCAYEYGGHTDGNAFCRKLFLRPKAMQEAHQLRTQLTRIVQDTFPHLDVSIEKRLEPPSNQQILALRQTLTAAFIDQVAVRADLIDPKAAAIRPLGSSQGAVYRAVGNKNDLFIHPGSILFHISPPELIVYTELVEASKPYLRGITRIERAWLPELGSSLCAITLIPQKHAAPGKQTGDGPITRKCVARRTFDAGGLDLDLGVEQRQQRLEHGRWILT